MAAAFVQSDLVDFTQSDVDSIGDSSSIDPNIMLEKPDPSKCNASNLTKTWCFEQQDGGGRAYIYDCRIIDQQYTWKGPWYCNKGARCAPNPGLGGMCSDGVVPTEPDP